MLYRVPIFLPLARNITVRIDYIVKKLRSKLNRIGEILIVQPNLQRLIDLDVALQAGDLHSQITSHVDHGLSDFFLTRQDLINVLLRKFRFFNRQVQIIGWFYKHGVAFDYVHQLVFVRIFTLGLTIFFESLLHKYWFLTAHIFVCELLFIFQLCQINLNFFAKFVQGFDLILQICNPILERSKVTLRKIDSIRRHVDSR